jgi:hypothetical protein
MQTVEFIEVIGLILQLENRTIEAWACASVLPGGTDRTQGCDLQEGACWLPRHTLTPLLLVAAGGLGPTDAVLRDSGSILPFRARWALPAVDSHVATSRAERRYPSLGPISVEWTLSVTFGSVLRPSSWFWYNVFCDSEGGGSQNVSELLFDYTVLHHSAFLPCV